jgi:hypothetical protein
MSNADEVRAAPYDRSEERDRLGLGPHLLCTARRPG